MNIEMMIQMIVAKSYLAQNILVLLGTLVVLGAAYVKLTPTKADDTWYAKLESAPILGDILKVLIKFSPITRKED